MSNFNFLYHKKVSDHFSNYLLENDLDSYFSLRARIGVRFMYHRKIKRLGREVFVGRFTLGKSAE